MASPILAPEKARSATLYRRVKQTVFIVLFIAALGLPFAVFNIFSEQLSMDSHENRLLNTLPTVLQSELTALPDALNNFLVDNSPFRYQFVLANAALNYHVFNTVESSQVILGRQNWLFYKDGPNAATPLANYQGLVRLDEVQLSAMAANLQSLADAFASNGGELVISFAPSKDIVYPEYVPADYPRLSETDVTQQVADYLRAHTSLSICFDTDAIQAHKSEYPVFFKYDTHWNHVGALIALDDVFNALSMETNRFVDYDFQVSGRQTGDMANVAALYQIFPDEEDYFPANYAYAQDKRNVIVYGDSFSEYYMPYLQKRFNNAWRDELANLNRNTLPDSGADIIIIEANERSFDTLMQVLTPH